MIGTGASPWRPYIASSRSDCSVLVGRPVDGPPRCTSMRSSGSSRLTARPSAFALEVDARPARGGDAELARERRADRDADGGDLVFGLQRAHAEVLVARQLVEDVGRRRDRVRRVEDRQVGVLRRREQPVRDRGVAADVAVTARRQRGRRDLVAGPKSSAVSPKCSPALNAATLASTHDLARAVTSVDPLERGVDRARVHPRDEPEREEVLRALGVARLDAELLARLERERSSSAPGSRGTPTSEPSSSGLTS